MNRISGTQADDCTSANASEAPMTPAVTARPVIQQPSQYLNSWLPDFIPSTRPRVIIDAVRAPASFRRPPVPEALYQVWTVSTRLDSCQSWTTRGRVELFSYRIFALHARIITVI